MPTPNTPSDSRVQSALASASPQDQAQTACEPTSRRQAREEAELDALYKAARAEGGRLIIYAGGDVANQQDDTREAFLQRFPAMDLRIIVDYSKFHDVRLDNQFATGEVIPDVIQLQTLQDFLRWAREGRLLPFKPEGFAHIHPSLKDRDGYWLATFITAFSYFTRAGSEAAAALSSPGGLIDPRWRGQIASSYPQDDDAVLFLYRLYVQRYGWDWLRALSQQDIRFARGSHTPGLAVQGGERMIGVGGFGALTDTADVAQWTIARGHPFMAWGQRAGILRQSRHPQAARLYLAWQASTARQLQASNGWSVRDDVQPPAGLAPIWTYSDAHFDAFPAFMQDRAEVERWRFTMTLYFGEVVGPPSPGWLGLRPGETDPRAC